MGQGPLSREPSVAAKFYNNGNTELQSGVGQVFAGPGNLWRLMLENNAASVAYLQIFNKLVADVTIGTTPPTYTIMVPASGSVILDPNDFPLYFFSIGCAISATTTRTGSSSAHLQVQAWYKS